MEHDGLQVLATANNKELEFRLCEGGRVFFRRIDIDEPWVLYSTLDPSPEATQWWLQKKKESGFLTEVYIK